MSLILLYFFMGVGLSMDAFSLAIVYGTNKISKKKAFILSLMVGVLHFIMPNLGSILGGKFLKGFTIYGNFIIAVVFFVLAIQMLLSFNEKEEVKSINNYLEMFFFAIAVSIDSFTLGMVLSFENYNVIEAGLIFSIISFTFTISGLLLGNYLSSKTGKIGKAIGIIILLIFALKYLFT